MATKSNIRSIRFSDEMADLIDRQTGETFTQKFENLITRCVWELPAKKKELASIQAMIDNKRRQLSDLQKATTKLNELEYQIRQAKTYCAMVEKTAKDITEKCNTD